MDVSIIIVNYNTSDLIIDCVKSIEELTKDVRYEVIIVDNNSEMDFEEKIRTGASIEINDHYHFIPLPENIGFGRANNEGLKIANGRNIFFLNPDTKLLNNAVKILSDFLDNNNKAGACGGNLFDENLNPTLSFSRWLPGIIWNIDEFFNFKIQKSLYKHNYNFNSINKILEVGFVTGADLMVKKFILNKIGGFSPEFFMYYEETDLCARIRNAGWKIYSVPQSLILHLESKSFSKSEAWQPEVKTRVFEKSRKIYYYRNTNLIQRKISFFIYNIILISRIMLIKDKRKKEYYQLRRRIFNSKD